eukprot:GSChrysophyteH1.ASY1.ANO1.3294.1 assembled CDS
MALGKGRKEKSVSIVAKSGGKLRKDVVLASNPATQATGSRVKTDARSRKKVPQSVSSSNSTTQATGSRVKTDAPSSKKVPQSVSSVSKRTDALTWDDFFMSTAFLSSMRSKDPSTQVGACIVNKDKRIVGIGYNGFPKNCDDDALPWARTSSSGDELDTKYPYVCHAEMNAILNRNSSSLENCSIYVGLFPCNECAKMIIQSGITEVVYYSDKYKSAKNMIASRILLDMAGVKQRQYTPRQAQIDITFPALTPQDKESEGSHQAK